MQSCRYNLWNVREVPCAFYRVTRGTGGGATLALRSASRPATPTVSWDETRGTGPHRPPSTTPVDRDAVRICHVPKSRGRGEGLCMARQRGTGRPERSVRTRSRVVGELYLPYDN